MSLETSITSKGGDQDALESLPREWIARQVAWERRLLVLSRRAEAALEEQSRLTDETVDAGRPAVVIHRLFGRRHRAGRSGHVGRRDRRKIAA